MMKSTIYSCLSSVLKFLVLFLAHPVEGTQWTIRSYVAVASSATTDRFSLTYTTTSTIYLSNLAATPTARPYSTTTDVETDLDVTYITYYVRADAVPQSIIASATRDDFAFDSPSTYTDFYMPIEYTAPASCPTPFTYTTRTLVYVPRGAESQVTPTSASTTTYGGTNDVAVSAFLSASAVPISTQPATTDFVYSYYIADCTNPATRTTAGYYSYPSSTGYYYGGGSYSGDYYDFDDSKDNCLGNLCPYWLIYIIIFCTIPPFLFICGLFESYFWFSRFMKGQMAFRGVPLSWVAISLWTLCCLRRSRHARPEEQAELQKHWRGMSTSSRLGLWIRYGFRHRDPPEVAAIRSKTKQEMAYNGGPIQQGYNYPSGQPPYYSGGAPPQGQYYPPPGSNGYYPSGSPPPQGQQYPAPQGQPQGPYYAPGQPGQQPYPPAPQQQQYPQQQPVQQQTRSLSPSDTTQQQSQASPVSPGSPQSPTNQTPASAPVNQQSPAQQLEGSQPHGAAETGEQAQPRQE